LAAKCPDDRVAYGEAKAVFIGKIVALEKSKSCENHVYITAQTLLKRRKGRVFCESGLSYSEKFD